jgi:TPR repeat protein
MNDTLGSTTSSVPDALHSNGDDLVRRTKRTVEDLRGAANEHHKLTLLKGSQDLVSNIHEVLRDIDEQSGKILVTIRVSTTIYNKLQSLLDAVNEVSVFFEEIKGTKFMFFAKGKLKRHMVIHYQTLKAKCTDLMSAVSLELLTNKDIILDTPEPVAVSPPKPAKVEDPYVRLEEQYMDGCRSFYGIDCPKNFNIAFDCFLYAAEKDHLKSMVMLAEMYQRGYSVSQDENVCIKWLEQAASMGSSAAKYHLAMKMTAQVSLCHYTINI